MSCRVARRGDRWLALRRSGLHSLWHPTKIFDLSHNTNTPELILGMCFRTAWEPRILIILKAVFLLSVQCVRDCDKAMDNMTQERF